ncbi:hypothetical protein C943_03420 [Mariniradius saccharolyticus AK6]|uniref:Protein SirB1 N-terminal domain-containing protein n=1 Tax=Mariniradius saccharolyticus AK6 TaxID=1239962 RepID=M7XJK2_9BACT|nr:hypothetical protein [Mariniradius saccharolyticus]EMS34733.1 hypothetical protein C943_03420 [Mariniradius saccharolyticus AK6]
MKAYLISFLLFFGLIESHQTRALGAADWVAQNKPSNVPVEDFSSFDFVSQWEQSHALFRKLVTKLGKDYKKYKGHPRFLKSLYYRTEMYLLEEYQQYSLLEDVMQEGKFDCVSGSLLLASLLDRFEIPYSIMETSHHVFVIVEQGGEEIILESTGGIDGFISGSAEVKNYLSVFGPDKTPNLNLNPRLRELESILNPSIYREISISQLKGLEHFNRAIFYNNEGNLTDAIEQLDEAKRYYPCDRVLAMENLLKNHRILAENE